MRTLLQTTSLWRMARSVKRSITPTRHRHGLAPDHRRGVVRLVDPPVALDPGRVIRWQVQILNQSALPWASAGSQPVELVFTWRTRMGTVMMPPVRCPLPRTAYPGEPMTMTVTAAAPDHVGDYTVEARLDQAGVAVGQPAEIAVPVMGGRAADIDYHEVYRTANLRDNHWWVVGQYPSREDYEKSQQARRGMLVAHAGLTPNSRVLDVGCGTGQMAAALADYLSDQGTYFGTDIGKEAIEFCQAKFTRPNFVFRQGGMTTIPFAQDDGTFDIAIFFSVFTHTYIDETVLLLAETKRLLSPRGCVMADVITSPLVDRAAGNRGEMIVNRDHFLRLAAAVGFPHSDVVGQWQWNQHADRYMYRLSQ